MRQGLARSDWTATGLLDGVPVCMFGVAPVNLMLGRGAPWMLAATGLDRMPFEILRHEFLPACDEAVDVMRAHYRFLFNVVHQRNRRAIRWLRMLGFNFGKRSEEHTSELQSLMRHSYAVFCLKKKNTKKTK